MTAPVRPVGWLAERRRLLAEEKDFTRITALGRQEEDLSSPMAWVKLHEEYARYTGDGTPQTRLSQSASRVGPHPLQASAAKRQLQCTSIR
jgi:hypothetical protein